MSAKKQKGNLIPLSLIFTLISMGLFIAKTLSSFYGKAQAEGASAITKYAVIPLLVVFAVCFVATVVMNIRDAKAIKASAADTKYAMKTTKTASAILEAFTQLIDVVIAIVIAYDAYAGVDIKWFDFRYYFTMIILVYTLFTTVYFIIKKSLKMKKAADKRSAAQAKEAEKQQKAAERQRQIEEATALKAQKEAERKAAEKAAMPVKDQSHKPIKKNSKK